MGRKSLLVLSGLILFLAVGCAPPVIHKINTSREFDAARIQRIAILNFDRGPGVTLARDVLVDKFTAALVDSKFRIVDRTDTRKIMEEAKFQQAGGAMIDETTREKLRQLGADTILTGNLHAYQEERKGNFVLYSEVHLTSKLLKVETGQVLWSGEIMKRSKAKNLGEKKILNVIDRESEADSAGKLLDDIISDMADSFKEKKPLMEKIKIW
ncbi:MAG: hypothetical protein CVU61_05380 [Deltaproteobacteria bacterium HGW-Deltaproteobacteria-19]|jgi:hypothetical protein|nr:MAG: hypothetical protein CVU61_05380 [Deltaproteobacteria bacterium HGW-Deltaproteobacteria-19]